MGTRYRIGDPDDTSFRTVNPDVCGRDKVCDKEEEYPSCSSLSNGETYKWLNKIFVDIETDEPVFAQTERKGLKNLNINNIRSVWNNFTDWGMYEGICREGNKWFAYKSHISKRQTAAISAAKELVSFLRNNIRIRNTDWIKNTGLAKPANICKIDQDIASMIDEAKECSYIESEKEADVDLEVELAHYLAQFSPEEQYLEIARMVKCFEPDLSDPNLVLPECGEKPLHSFHRHRAIRSMTPTQPFDIVDEGYEPSLGEYNIRTSALAYLEKQYGFIHACKKDDPERPGQFGTYLEFPEPLQVTGIDTPYDLPYCASGQAIRRVAKKIGSDGKPRLITSHMHGHISSQTFDILPDENFDTVLKMMDNVNARDLCQVRVNNSPDRYALFYSTSNNPVAPDNSGEPGFSEGSGAEQLRRIRGMLPGDMAKCEFPEQQVTTMDGLVREGNRLANEAMMLSNDPFVDLIERKTLVARIEKASVRWLLDNPSQKALAKAILFGAQFGLTDENLIRTMDAVEEISTTGDQFIYSTLTLILLDTAHDLHKTNVSEFHGPGITPDFDKFVADMKGMIMEGKVKVGAISNADAPRLAQAGAVFNNSNDEISYQPIDESTPIFTMLEPVVHESWHAWQHITPPAPYTRTSRDIERGAYEAGRKTTLLAYDYTGKTGDLMMESADSLVDGAEEFVRAYFDTMMESLRCYGWDDGMLKRLGADLSSSIGTELEWQSELWEELRGIEKGYDSDSFERKLAPAKGLYTHEYARMAAMMMAGTLNDEGKTDEMKNKFEQAKAALPKIEQAYHNSKTTKTGRARLAFSYLWTLMTVQALAYYLDKDVWRLATEQFLDERKEILADLIYMPKYF